MNGIVFIDFNLATCDFLTFDWYKMLNGYIGVSFLDLLTDILKNKLITSLFGKATDAHQHLNYSSGHLEHTKWSIIYSEL